MYIFMLVIVFSYVIYAFFKKRSFDLLALYGVFLILFSLPTIMGVVYDPNTKAMKELNNEVYFITALTVFFLLIIMVFKDLLLNHPPRLCTPLSDKEYNSFLFVGSAITLLLSLDVFPSVFFSKSKVEVLESANITHLLLSSIVPALFIAALMKGVRKYVCFFLLVLILFFMFGSRRPLSLAIVGAVFIVLIEHRFVLISKWRVLLAGIFFLGLVILGKTLYGYFLIGGIAGIQLWFKELNLDMVFSGAEFMGTSAILNEVVVTGFSLPFESVPYSFASLLPIPVSFFGLSSSAFNEQFQSVLFSSIDYGMAYNPWAEAYAWSGYIGIVIYSIMLPLSLLSIERIVLKYRFHPIGGLFVIIGALLCLWIHRNSLASEFAYIRNVFYPFVFIYFIGKFFNGVNLKLSS